MSAPFVSVVAAALKLRYIDETASRLTLMLRNHESNVTMTKGGYLIKGIDFKSVLSTDFLADYDYKYITPSKITVKLVSSESTLKQNMRDRKNVEFLATIIPAVLFGLMAIVLLVWYPLSKKKVAELQVAKEAHLKCQYESNSIAIDNVEGIESLGESVEQVEEEASESERG